MKVCPHCGRRYQGSMTLCSFDATPLRSVADPLSGRTLAGKSRIEQRALNERVAKADEPEEITVVRSPVRPVAGEQGGTAPPAALSFNPWRIVVPSAVALLVVFAIVFVFTRNTEKTQNQQTPGQPGMAVDPNSQAVQPTGTPTGEGEQGIHPVSEASPAGGGLSTNANVNANVNTKVNANVNANVNRNRPVPSPRATNLNQNERSGKPKTNANRALELELPSPNPTPSVETTPTPKQLKPSPTASPAKSAGSPPAG